MKAKKELGQNFLMHPQIAERIVRAAEVTAGDTVLEIGPGTGLLTTALLACAKKVVAVETDADLIPLLENKFAVEIEAGRLELRHEDIRSFDPCALGEYRLVANIPYYITGEIIRQFLTSTHKPSSMTLLVQKEVAERIARSKKESLLSLSVKAFGTPSFAFKVPRGAFRPAPNVDSAVLTIKGIRPDAFSSSEDEEHFFRVLRAGFAHKRKLLARNLEEVGSRDAILRAFAASGLPEKARAEDVSLDSWKRLALAIHTE